MLSVEDANALAMEWARLPRWTVVGWQRRHGKLREATFDDAVSVATVAMVVCTRTYDPAKGKFSTYAVRAMTHTLGKFFVEDRLVRVPMGSFRVRTPGAVEATRRRARSMKCILRMASPASPVSQNDSAWLRDGLAALDEDDRELLVGLFFRGETLDVWKVRLGLCRQGVQMRRDRALRQLRDVLEGRPGKSRQPCRTKRKRMA